MPDEMCAAWYHTSTSRIALIADFLRRISTDTWPSLFLKAAVWVVVFEFWFFCHVYYLSKSFPGETTQILPGEKLHINYYL